MDDVSTYSKVVKAEADKLLSETELPELLGGFGKVSLGGSYAYDLMVDKDLDFGVLVDSMTPELRSEIVSTFAKQPWAYSVNMTDRINFEPLSNLSAPRGLFVGLTIPFPKERWNVDIWFTIGKRESETEVTKLLRHATPEQRAVIINIKYALIKDNKNQKGITSAEVYKAVMNDGIQTAEEFLALE